MTSGRVPVEGGAYPLAPYAAPDAVWVSGDDETCVALGGYRDVKFCGPTCTEGDASNCTSRRVDLTQCLEGSCADER